MASRIAASRGSSSSTTRAARIMPTCRTSQRVSEKNRWAREWCHTPARPAPVNIPHTVRSTGRRMKPVNIAVNTSISRCGETGTETLQQRRQGIGYTDLGGHWWNTPIYWRCCKHHQCSAPFHEMPGRRAVGMAFNLRTSNPVSFWSFQKMRCCQASKLRNSSCICGRITGWVSLRCAIVMRPRCADSDVLRTGTLRGQ